jgi:hypothetical protein
MALVIGAGLFAATQPASGNPVLDDEDLACTPYPHFNPNNNQIYSDNAGDKAAADALAADGFACTALLNKGQLPNTFQHVGEAWFKTVSGTLQIRFIIFGGSNTGLSGDNKVCLDDDGDPINNIIINPGSAKYCEGGDAQTKVEASNANAGTIDCDGSEEPAGKFEYQIEKITNQTFTVGGTQVGGWNVFIDACTEILPHFNANGFSIVAYFQPHIPVPDLKIKIEGTQTNEVGVAHTFTVTVEFDPDTTTGTGFAPLSGVNPVVTLAGSNGIVNPVATTDNCAVTGTDANGQCTVIVNSNVPGQITANASITHASLTRDTDPNTATVCGGGVPSCGPAVKTYVDAKIDINPKTAQNNVTDNHEVTVTVTQNDGTGGGYVAATVGHVDLKLINSGGANAVINAATTTCHSAVGGYPAGPHADDNLEDGLAPPPAAGTCVVNFTSATAGTVTANAMVSLTVGGVALVRDTEPAVGAVCGGGVNDTCGPAVKTFVAGIIVIEKRSTKTDANGDNVLVFDSGSGALFSVDGPSPDLTADFEVRDNDDPTVGNADAGVPDVSDESDTFGIVCVSGLVPGADYAVDETEAPTGYGDASEGPVTVTAVAGSCDDLSGVPATAIATFTNPPLFDIQVNFRDAGSGETSIVSIVCTDVTGLVVINNLLDGTAATDWDASQTTEDLEFVPDAGNTDGHQELICTLEIDP